MSSLARNLDPLSVQDYLAGERISAIKHEYVQGQVYAMAGAKLNHNRITRNLSALLWNALKGQPCEPVTSDMLLKTRHNAYRYPDIMVVCNDDPATDDFVREAPILIVEVLSSSTRRSDKTEKRAEYLALPSLQEYMLVDQDIAEVEVQRRNQDWRSCYYYLGQEITLESVNLTLPVEALYERVQNEDMQAWLAALSPASR